MVFGLSVTPLPLRVPQKKYVPHPPAGRGRVEEADTPTPLPRAAGARSPCQSASLGQVSSFTIWIGDPCLGGAAISRGGE